MDEREFAERARACERKLYRVARTLLRSNADCEDAVQEALVRAWRAKDALREADYFDTWLIRILINECRRLHRRGGAKLLPLAAAEAVPAPAPAADEDARVVGALYQLPEKVRLAMVMHYIEGYGVDRIAAILRAPAGTVKWRLHQGRKQLARLLDGEDEEI